MHKVIKTCFGIQVQCWSLVFKNKNPILQKTCTEGVLEERASFMQKLEERAWPWGAKANGYLRGKGNEALQQPSKV